jgi:hypothetical protein
MLQDGVLPVGANKMGFKSWPLFGERICSARFRHVLGLSKHTLAVFKEDIRGQLQWG